MSTSRKMTDFNWWIPWKKNLVTCRMKFRKLSSRSHCDQWTKFSCSLSELYFFYKQYPTIEIKLKFRIFSRGFMINRPGFKALLFVIAEKSIIKKYLTLVNFRMPVSRVLFKIFTSCFSGWIVCACTFSSKYIANVGGSKEIFATIFWI